MTGSEQVAVLFAEQRRIVLAWLGGSMLFATALIATIGLGGFRVNVTPSEPMGLWRIRPLDGAIHIGDLVFICPPATPVMREARRRGYLRRGLCEGGVAPLIKTVAAVPGQVIEVNGSVRIDGQPLPHSEVALKDGQGRATVPSSGGVVPAYAIYLHSEFPGSFDSRYFGPLPIDNVLGLAQEVWTYAP